jgi:hypothetical protein
MCMLTHLIHRSALSLCLFAALMLGACGPGTGGTGTGPPIANSSFFASTTTGAAPTAPACGASCTSNLNGQPLALNLLADSITLSSPCATFTYSGAWSGFEAEEVTVEGVLESTAIVNGQPTRSRKTASMKLQFTGSPNISATVTIDINDSTGISILRPVTLSRVGAEISVPAAAPCA